MLTMAVTRRAWFGQLAACVVAPLVLRASQEPSYVPRYDSYIRITRDGQMLIQGPATIGMVSGEINAGVPATINGWRISGNV